MASVTLMARMVGDAKSLISSVDQSDTRLGKFQNTVKAMQGPLLVAGGAIAGATLKFASMGDEIAKMSTRTGFSTEALSEWRFAADQSGASLQGLEVGVRRMQRTIVDADEGLKSASDSLRLVGVTSQELMGLSPEQQFERLAEAIASVEDPTIKAAAAQEIFGRQGTQLLPLFEAGAEGIAELRQQARDLGIVMDRETAAKAERMGDAINSAQQVLTATAIDIGATVAPIVSTLAEGFAQLPGILQKVILVAGTFFTAMKVGFISLKQAVVSSGVGIALVAIGEIVSRVTGHAEDLAVAIRDLSDASALTQQNMHRLAIETDMTDEKFLQLFSSYGVGRDELIRLIEAEERQIAALRSAQSEHREGTAAWQRWEDRIAPSTRLLGIYRQALDEASLRTDKLRGASIDLANAQKDLQSTALAAALAERILAAEMEGGEGAMVATIFALEEEIETLRRVMQQEERLKEIINGLTGANARQADSFREVEGSASGAGGAVSGAGDEMDAAAEKTRKLEQAMREAQSRADSLARSAASLGDRINQDFLNNVTKFTGMGLDPTAAADVAGALRNAEILERQEQINRALQEGKIDAGTAARAAAALRSGSPDPFLESLGLVSLAEGGIVRARPGGTLARIGEGGRDEAVVPLPQGGAQTIVMPVSIGGERIADIVLEGVVLLERQGRMTRVTVR